MSAGPRGLLSSLHKVALVVATLLVLVVMVLSLVGMRSDVGVLSGTQPTSAAALSRGVAYAVSWFGAILLAPPLALFVLLDVLAEQLPGIVRWIASLRR